MQRRYWSFCPRSLIDWLAAHRSDEGEVQQAERFQCAVTVKAGARGCLSLSYRTADAKNIQLRLVVPLRLRYPQFPL